MFHSVGDETVVECPATQSLPASVCVVNGHVVKRFTITGRSELLQVFRGHTDDIICLKQFASRHLFTSSFDRTVIVWSLADGDILRRIIGFSRAIVGLSTLLWHGTAGRRMVVNDTGGCVEVWDLSGTPSKTVEVALFEQSGARGTAESPGHRLLSVAPGNQCVPLFRYDTFHDHLLVLAYGCLHCICPISGKHCGSAGDSLADWCRVDENSFLFLHRDGSVESTHVEWLARDSGTGQEHNGRRWACNGDCQFAVTRKWLWDADACPNSITTPTAVVAVEFLCCPWLNMVVVSTALYACTSFNGRVVILDLTSGTTIGVPGFITSQPNLTKPASSNAEVGPKVFKRTTPHATKWSTLRTGVRVAGSFGLLAAQTERLAAEKASEDYEQALFDSGWHRDVLFQKLNVVGLFLTGTCVSKARSAMADGVRCSFLLWDLSSLDHQRSLLERGVRPPALMGQSSCPARLHRSVATISRAIHRDFSDVVQQRQRSALRRQGKEIDGQINMILRTSRPPSNGEVKAKSNPDLRANVASTLRAAKEARERANSWIDDWERRKNPWRHETIDDLDSEDSSEGSAGRPDSLVDFSDDSDDYSEGEAPLVSHSVSRSVKCRSQGVLDNHGEEAAARQSGQAVLQLQQTVLAALDASCESLLNKNGRIKSLLTEAAETRAGKSYKDLEVLRLDAALQLEQQRNADLKRLLAAKLSWHREMMNLEPRTYSNHDNTRSRAGFLMLLISDVRRKLALYASPQSKKLCSPLVVNTTTLPFFRQVSHRRLNFDRALARPLMLLHCRCRVHITAQSSFAAPERVFSTGDRVVLLGVQGVRLESCVRLTRKRRAEDAKPNGDHARSILGTGSSGVVTGYREVTGRFYRVYVAVAFPIQLCVGQRHQVVLLVPSHRLAAFPALSRRVSVSSAAFTHPAKRIPLTGQFQIDVSSSALAPASGDLCAPKPARFLCGLHFVGIHTGAPEMTVLVQHDVETQLCRVRFNPCIQAFSELSVDLKQRNLLQSTLRASDRGHGECRAHAKSEGCLRAVEVHVGVSTASCLLSDHPFKAGTIEPSCCVLPLPLAFQSMRSLAHYNAENRGSDCCIAPCALLCLPARPELVTAVKVHTLPWGNCEPQLKQIANVAKTTPRNSNRSGSHGINTCEEEIASPQRIAFFLVLLRGNTSAWDEVCQNFFDITRGTGPGTIDHGALRASYEEAWRKTWNDGGDVGQSPPWPSSADGEDSSLSQVSDEELRRFYHRALFFAKRDGLLITCSAFGSASSRIQFWNLASGAVLRKQLFSIDCAAHLPVRPDVSVCGALFRGCMYVGFSDGAVHAWRVGGEQAQGPLFSFRGHVGGVRLLLLLRPRTLVTASAEDHVISVWGSECGGDRAEAAVFLLRGHNQCISQLVAQGDFVISIAHDRTMRIWNLLDGVEVHMLLLQSIPTCVDARFLSKPGPNGLSPDQALYLVTAVGLRDGAVLCHTFFVDNDMRLKLGSNSVQAIAAHDGPTSCVQFVGKRSTGVVAAATDTRCQIDRCRCGTHSYFEHRLVSCGLSDARICMWTIETDTLAGAECAIETVLAAPPGIDGLIRQICFDAQGRRLLACVSSNGGQYGNLLSFDIGEMLCVWGQQSTVVHGVTSGSSIGDACKSSREPIDERARESRSICRGHPLCGGSSLSRVGNATAGCRSLAFQIALFVFSYVQLGCVAHASLSALAGGGSAAHVTVFGAKYSYIVWAIQTLGISTLPFSSAVVLMALLWVAAMLPCILQPVISSKRFSSATRRSPSLGHIGSTVMASALQLACTLSGGLGQVLCISSIRAAVFLTQCDSYYSIAWPGTNTSRLGWSVPTTSDSKFNSTTSTPQDPSEFIQSPVWTCQIPALIHAGYRQISQHSDCIAAGISVGLFSNYSAASISNTAAQSVAGVDVAGCVVDAQGALFFHDIPYDDTCQRCESAQGYLALCEWTSQTTASAAPPLSGCMDAWAYNYDPLATAPDPAACVYDVFLRVASPHIECYGGNGAYGQSFLVQSSFIWAVLCVIFGVFYTRIIRVGGRIDAFEQLRRTRILDFKVDKSKQGAPTNTVETDVEAGCESLTTYSIVEGLIQSGDLGDMAEVAVMPSENITAGSPFDWDSDSISGLTFSADERLTQDGIILSRGPTCETASAPLRFCSPHLCHGSPTVGGIGQESLVPSALDRHPFSERSPFFGLARVVTIILISIVQLVGMSFGGLGLNSTLAAAFEQGSSIQESIFLPDEIRWASVIVSAIQIAAVAVLVFVGSASVWWTVQPARNGGWHISCKCCCRVGDEHAPSLNLNKNMDFDSNSTKSVSERGCSQNWLLNVSLGRFWSGSLLNKIALGCDAGILSLFTVNFVLHCLSLHFIETGTSVLNGFQPGGVSLAIGLLWLSFAVPSAFGISAAAWPKSQQYGCRSSTRHPSGRRRFVQMLAPTFESGTPSRATFGDLISPVGPPPEGTYR